MEAGRAPGAAERRAARRRVALALGAAAAALALLRAFPPGPGAFWPPCPTHALLGLLCPGCGTLRGLAALAAGDPWGLARGNLLAFALLPVPAWWLLGEAARAAGRRLPAWRPGPRALRGLAALVVLWAVARNLSPLLAPRL